MDEMPPLERYNALLSLDHLGLVRELLAEVDHEAAQISEESWSQSAEFDNTGAKDEVIGIHRIYAEANRILSSHNGEQQTIDEYMLDLFTDETPVMTITTRVFVEEQQIKTDVIMAQDEWNLNEEKKYSAVTAAIENVAKLHRQNQLIPQ